MTLRPYQTKLKNDVYAAWAQGAQNVVMVLSTGGGKTMLFSEIAQEHAGPVAFIAHRRELVSQMSLALARNGLRHNIIASATTRRAIAQDHLAAFGRSYYDPTNRSAVCSIDTLVRADDVAGWASQVTLWVTDECFPAGTLVDGQPIESLRVGDEVTGFNEHTGTFERRKVVRTFKNPLPSEMVRLDLGPHVLWCTRGHPFWTQRGWVNAAELTDRDMVLHVVRGRDKRNGRTGSVSAQKDGADFLYPEVRDSASRNAHMPRRTEKRAPADKMCNVRSARRPERAPSFSLQKDGACLLQRDVLQSLPGHSVLRDDGADQSTLRVGTHDLAQSDATRGGARTNAPNAPGEGDRPNRPGRQWPTGDDSGSDFEPFIRRAGVRSSVGHFDPHGAGVGISDMLQTGPSAPRPKTSVGGGRGVALRSKGARPEERYVSKWVGVDSVTVHKSTNMQRDGHSIGDGFVYNIEVDGVHTYTADGIVVHNCHHVVLDNKWHRGIQLFTNPSCRGLLPTATPIRADGKGLGRHADGIADAMVEGPPMRWLIEDGWLTDYRMVLADSDMELLESKVGASGDWSVAVQREAAEKSHIVGDTVKAYLEHTPGKLDVTFTSDTTTALKVFNAYTAKGVRAGLLTGETDAGLRRQMIRQFERREITQLVVVDVISEGFDMPAMESCGFARKTMSLATYMQQFGRVLRPLWPAGFDANTATRAERLAVIAASPKPKAIVRDHVGNFLHHRAPDRPRVWTLDRSAKRGGGGDGIPMRPCLGDPPGTGCYQPFERFYTECPYCGAGVAPPEPAARSSPAMVDGDLSELSPDVLAAMRGELDALEILPDAYAMQLAARNMPDVGVQANYKRRVAHHDAQGALRIAMTQWAGPHHAAGRSDREIQRLFWHSFGVDVVTALTLKPDEAATLTGRLSA